MKKVFLFVTILICALSCNAQSAKVVHITKSIKGVDKMLVEPGWYPYTIMNGKVALDLGQDGTTITVAQFKQFKTAVWTAAQGHGYIIEKGRAIVRAQPNDNAKAIGRIDGEIDGYPDDYECLGVVGDWYKIRNVDRTEKWKVGYVRKPQVKWSIGSADCAGCIR